MVKGGVPQAQIEKLARDDTISFEMTEAVEKELRDAGASESIVTALKELAPRPANQGNKRLTIEMVMELLSGGVPVARVTILVEQRGVDFELTQKLEGAFRDSGADQGLLVALKQYSSTVSGGGAPGAMRVSQVEAPASPETQTPAEPAPSQKPSPVKRGGAQVTGLRIRSQPGNASIFLDDQPVGKTDAEEGTLEVVPVKPGKHRLRAKLDGYQDLEGPVEVAAGRMLETPIWLAKSEAPAAPQAPSSPELPAGKKFLVRHTHLALGGGPAYCQGWLVVAVGYVRYVSTDSPHTYLMGTSEMRDARASGGGGGITIKLDFGRQYQFEAVDEKGREVSAGPILAEIRYSMGK